MINLDVLVEDLYNKSLLIQKPINTASKQYIKDIMTDILLYAEKFGVTEPIDAFCFAAPVLNDIHSGRIPHQEIKEYLPSTRSMSYSIILAAIREILYAFV